jgi:hypothetical protein
VKERRKLHSLRIDHFTIRSELICLIGAKAAGTGMLELWCSSNPAKNPLFNVRFRSQPTRTRAGLVFGRVWNRTELTHQSKPGPLAGYRDLLLTLSLPAQYSRNSLWHFVSKFQSQWLHLTTLSNTSSDSYWKTFAAFLGEEKAKSYFLMGFIVKHNPNVIDNLTTKYSSLYADVKQ